METDDLDQALKELKAAPKSAGLIPEVGMNIAYAKEGAKGLEDVAAFPGRIRKAFGTPSVAFKAAFGVESHMAKLALQAMKRDASKRCAMNIKYSEANVKALEGRGGLKVVFVDRAGEPSGSKALEGRSVSFVLEEAIKKLGGVPDAVYDRGDVGKEPMIRLLSESPAQAVRAALACVAPL
ncbi:MAG: thiamine-phosphate synthase [Candidatus Diapherotrites archaeon]|nr:thiamine-phosphate synthase [Candidatus Diapherotrites archaeon]